MAVGMISDDEFADDNQCGKDVANLSDDVGESVELLVERRADAVVNLRSLEDLSVLGLVADSLNTEYAVTFHNLCATEHAVGGVSGVLVEVVLTNALVADGLSGE